MRVIAGTAHGTPLQTLPGEVVTRPTIARVKEAMFSSVQFLLPGARVLDLFAGSGQLGIEALSRGAVYCHFVDSSRQAAGIVRANCRAAGVQAAATVIAADAFSFLQGAGLYDLVLLDPPFGHGTLERILPQLPAHVAPGGVVLAESERNAVLPAETGTLVRKKQYQYGKILVTRYEQSAP